jgi:hypothetical protein
MLRIGKQREEYFAVAQAALLEAKHRKSIGNPGEKRYLLRQRGNESASLQRLVGHCWGVNALQRGFRRNT